MNRKNVIENVIYVCAIIGLIVLFSVTAQDRNDLRETLHEKEKVISDMNVETKRLNDQVLTYQSEVDTINMHFADVSSSYEKTLADQVLLSEKITGLEKEKATLLENVKTANSKVSSLQTENANLKKNKAPVTTVSRSNNSSTGKTFHVTATAYTAYCTGCSGTTAIGIDLRKNPSLKVIAVDPRIIPLGTKVWVEGYGNAIAGDTGGAIKGHKIDLFMADRSDALRFGRKTIQVKILGK